MGHFTQLSTHYLVVAIFSQFSSLYILSCIKLIKYYKYSGITKICSNFA